MLFGIQEPGKLGQSNELKFSYDIFKNTYVNFKQKQIESVLNYFAEIMGIPNPDLKLQDVDPIGIPFTDQTIVQVAPIEWIWEKLGIDPAKYPNAQPAIPPKVATTPPPPGQTNPADSINVENSLPVNENLKNLTAKQHQQIMRIVRQCSKGQMTREAAAAMLKGGWALTDAEVDTFLGSPDQFDKEFTEEEVADMFSEFGESKEHFEIVKSKPARFTEEEFSLTEVFGAKEDASGGAALKPPSKIQKILSEVSIKYSYSVQPGAGPAIIPGTRPFCKKLVELNRLYTREQIQQISQRVGYSVWERRGGFWNNHGTIEPHCRHQWQSHIVIKKT